MVLTPSQVPFSLDAFHPEHVITVYSNSYVGHRKVSKNGRVSAETPLYKQTASDLFRVFHSETKDWSFRSLIPRNVLYFKSTYGLSLFWIFEAAPRDIWYRKNARTFAIPHTVFGIHNDNLYVVALNELTNDPAEQQVFVAPFPNQTSNGMCMGSASLKLDSVEYVDDAIAYAEGQFFNSEFTHNLDKDYYTLGFGKKNFPYKHLKPIEGMSVKKWIEDVTG